VRELRGCCVVQLIGTSTCLCNKATTDPAGKEELQREAVSLARGHCSTARALESETRSKGGLEV
jgi:hypothetical protein